MIQSFISGTCAPSRRAVARYASQSIIGAAVEDVIASSTSPTGSVRNSSSARLIFGRIVLAAYSCLSLTTHAGTTLCASTSIIAQFILVNSAAKRSRALRPSRNGVKSHTTTLAFASCAHSSTPCAASSLLLASITIPFARKSRSSSRNPSNANAARRAPPTPVPSSSFPRCVHTITRDDSRASARAVRSASLSRIRRSREHQYTTVRSSTAL
mmetsp:Transcript_8898/g.33026  ORF Transcript_8898/g.33026 Transcript_8898/m.33026 type:complete len:213 (+) Transcript_8898:808-1446(+)